MKSMLPIAVDLKARELRLGSVRVRLQPAMPGPSSTSADVFFLNDVRGPLVRALHFEERSLLLADVPDSEIAARIAKAALLAPDDAPDEICVAVALALAGGGEQAPPFVDCGLFVAQQDGWDQHRVSETMALLVDKLCGEMADQPSNNGWKQIVFEEPEPDLTTLISLMAQNLSQRAGSAPASGFEPETRAAADELKNTNARPLAERTRSTNSSADLRQRTAAPINVNSQPGTKPLPVSSIVAVEQRDAGPILTSSPGTFRSISATAIPSVTSAGVTNREAQARPLPLRISARVMAGSRGHSVNTQTIAPAVSVIGNPTENPQVLDSTWERPEPSTLSARSASTNHAGLQVDVALQQPVAVSRPIAFDLNKRSFPSLSTDAQAPQAATQASVGAEAPAFSAWLAELAAQLETECDMRGIDP